MGRTTTRSPDVELPDAGELARLKLSPEVAWYLLSRGIPLPDCPPRWKTPEPRNLPGARFDPARVDKVLAAFGRLRHTQGEWAGRPLKPDPWQVAYILAPVYGWVRQNDRGVWVRIIRTEYVDIPRKNGKTTLAGGQAAYLTCADGEQGGQVIAAAAGKDQAGYCFAPVKLIAEKSPFLAPHVKCTASKIVHKRSGSYFTVVSSVADLLHGANVHAAVIDELHIHKSRDLVDALETGTGARAQPLIIIITTADDGRRGTIYAEKRHYCEQLARGALVDATFYGVVWATEDDDQYGEAPFLEETWRKANPGYGISPTREFMRAEATKARQSPANLARFLRLHLGIRTKQESRYITLEVWDRNAGLVDETALRGRAAYGGLDLSRTHDLTALAWLFPDEGGGYDALWRIWVPEARMPDLDKRTAGLASVWAREGLLQVSSGDVIDYELIKTQMRLDLAAFQVAEVGYDRWNATQLITDMTGEGAPMVPIGQGFASMSPPMKELATLLLRGTAERPVFRHGGHPLVRWMVDNLAVAMDAAGNYKPDKQKSGDNIDAVSAMVTALARAMLRQVVRSAYEDHDVDTA
ncbi:terminase large subunit [Sphaerisporangium sp. NPDC004334]